MLQLRRPGRRGSAGDAAPSSLPAAPFPAHGRLCFPSPALLRHPGPGPALPRPGSAPIGSDQGKGSARHSPQRRRRLQVRAGNGEEAPVRLQKQLLGLPDLQRAKPRQLGREGSRWGPAVLTVLLLWGPKSTFFFFFWLLRGKAVGCRLQGQWHPPASVPGGCGELGTHLEQVTPHPRLSLSPCSRHPHLPEPGPGSPGPSAPLPPCRWRPLPLSPGRTWHTLGAGSCAERREGGSRGGGGETWEFPTMHLCRLHEDGEQGGGERALQSRGKGWELEGQVPKRGPQRGKGSSAASPRPLSFGAELAQQFRAVPAALTPPLLHLFLLRILPGFAAIT